VPADLIAALPSRFPSDPADAVTTLRTATRDHHQRVDHLMDLARMQEPGHYARVLQILDAFLAGWEPAVLAALPARWHGWLRARSRRAFLRRDMQDLGVAALPPVNFAPLRDAAAAWGAIYVMEGSALGGQLISRTLARAGLDAAHGAAYFHGWGEATGAMWREVRELLASGLQAQQALAHACEAARQTFDGLSLLLESLPHERASAA
jgi:heme oxygenase